MPGTTTILGLTTIVNSDTVDLVTHMSTGIAQRTEDLLSGAAAPAGSITVAWGTITADRGLKLTATFNAGGVTFVPFDINATYTAAAAASRLARVRQDSNVIFEVAAVSGAATGIGITPAAAGSRVGVAVLSTGVNEGLDIDAKGSGTIRLGNTSTGAITLGRATTVSAGGLTVNGTISGYTDEIRFGSTAASPDLGISSVATGNPVMAFDHRGAANAGLFIWRVGTDAATERMRISAGGILLINDSSNAQMTIGLTINQGANDNEILALKSSDVAHGMTSITETDTYGYMVKAAAASGGTLFDGLSSGTGRGLWFRGIHTTDDTTKATTSLAPIEMAGLLKSGATAGDIGANANIIVFRNNGTTRFILDGDGDSHQDVGTAWTNFDHHDDAALLNSLALHVARADDPIRDDFRQWATESRERLQALKVVTFNEDGHHFVNMSKLSMLLVGALRQQHARIAALEQKLLVE